MKKFRSRRRPNRGRRRRSSRKISRYVTVPRGGIRL